MQPALLATFIVSSHILCHKLKLVVGVYGCVCALCATEMHGLLLSHWRESAFLLGTKLLIVHLELSAGLIDPGFATSCSPTHRRYLANWL